VVKRPIRSRANRSATPSSQNSEESYRKKGKNTEKSQHSNLRGKNNVKDSAAKQPRTKSTRKEVKNVLKVDAELEDLDEDQLTRQFLKYLKQRSVEVKPDNKHASLTVPQNFKLGPVIKKEDNEDGSVTITYENIRMTQGSHSRFY
jgi:hypothetical protein